MKRMIHILLMLLMFCLSGCQGSSWFEDNSSLDYIDSLFAENKYAEAYNVVISIDSLMFEKSYRARMRFELQKIKAEDKISKPLLTDSIILPIIDYYETEGDKRYLSEAYYYAGRIYRQLDDSPRALEFFNKSLEAIGSNDYQSTYIRSKIHSQKGDIYRSQALYDLALNEHEKFFQYATSILDSLGMFGALCNLGYCYLEMGIYETSHLYYDRAVELALKQNDKSLLSFAMIRKAEAYNYQGNYNKAEEYLRLSIDGLNEEYRDIGNSVAGYIYFKQRKYDLARPYFEMMLKSPSVGFRQQGEAMLLSMAVNEKDLDGVIKHIIPYKELTDSLSIITDSEKIARINSLYNSQRLEKEKDRLERRNLQYTYFLIIGGLLFLVFISMFAVYNYRVRAERNRLRYNNTMLDQFLKEEQLKRVATEQEKQQIQAERDRLANVSMMEQLRMAQGDSKKQTIQGSAVYEKLLNSEKAVTDKELKDAEELINVVYPDFITRLHTLGVNKPQDMKVCLLLKMGLSPSHIASLLSRRESTLTNARKNLFKKITGKEGKADEFDKIIKGI